MEQAFHRVPGTVKDQITLFDDSFTMEEVRGAARIAGLDATIEQLEKGYDTPCTQEIFSQGQWQLLSIARAAVQSPNCFFWMRSLQTWMRRQRRAVLAALKRVAKDRTVISISHRTYAELGRTIQI